ncbi:MAG: RluA family pseudouridine synthase [Alphaproteobacteria bacterium]|nr:RluA family pseudouridine synthase [Alphaproteobacteria bacterium]
MSFLESDIVYNPPTHPYVSIVHRDDDILVVDKPSGLLSVPGRHPSLSDSLATRIQKESPHAKMINRLDKDTSGLVLISLNKKAHAHIAKQFEERTTKKSYIAIVWGHIEENEGMIDLPLAIDPDNKPRHRVDHTHGKPAQTQWRIVERLQTQATRMQLTPLTGRTHQLRVHMKSTGHVILGDSLYAEGKALDAADRLMLHAETLAFHHPQGDEMTFTAPCPF